MEYDAIEYSHVAELLICTPLICKPLESLIFVQRILFIEFFQQIQQIRCRWIAIVNKEFPPLEVCFARKRIGGRRPLRQ